jgi:hypothetical protein
MHDGEILTIESLLISGIVDNGDNQNCTKYAQQSAILSACSCSNLFRVCCDGKHSFEQEAAEIAEESQSPKHCDCYSPQAVILCFL